MEKIRLNINGAEVEGFKGQTILDVAEENNIHIPTLCYDKRLEIYGSCGICVVEAEGMPKLLRACATEISNGMIIKTDSKRVLESRKVNLELLLSQHKGDCVAPCVLGCPAQTDCQGYVGLIANGENAEAIKLIKAKVPLPASIGRVCPHPCESECRRKLVEEPVSILHLKRYAADIDLDNPEPYLPQIAESTGKSVAVVGGGPGGLSCAYFLAEMGHGVTVFEMMPKMGGMLRYGIPEYRLPKIVVDKEAALIEKMGVVFKNNIKIGTDITYEYLRKNYDAVVIAIGAWTSVPLPCPGAELDGVYGGIDFLRKIVANEPVYIGKRVAVVGGGNTAMDACRTAIRLGAEKVYNVYRRTRAEMPAEEIEIVEAGEEGVIFKFLTNPLEVLGENGKVKKVRLQKMRLGEPDSSGRRRPEPVEGEDELLEVDAVICALGQGIDPDGFTGVELSRWKTVVADENTFTTNEEGVFAIGDCINDGASIAIEAIGNAKKASMAIADYLGGVEITQKSPYRVKRDDLTEDDFTNHKKEPRSLMKHESPDARRDNFLEFTETFDDEAAKKDALRCLECGCHDYFECKLISIADKYDVKPDRFRESVPEIEFTDDHPFIARDPHKCVLCGLCVRMCDEVIGSTALGFVQRGYETVVRPAFDKSLTETSCISCGQCVSVCPTGALQERLTLVKPVPLDTVKTKSLCGMCGVGCPVILESAGSMFIKTTPGLDSKNRNELMCARGRFGLNFLNNQNRITSPLIRKNGKLTPASWNEAFVFAAKKMESIKSRGEKTAVAIGHAYCIGDAGAVKNLAEELGSEIFSYANRENGLAKVIGFDRSPNTLEEVAGCDKIIVFSSALFKKPTLLAKLRAAIEDGAVVTVISDADDEFNIPCELIKTPNSTDFIKQVIKALIGSGCAPKNAVGFDELKNSLEKVQIGEDAKVLAESYKLAKKAMIIYSIEELSSIAATEIANMAVVSGHIGSPRSGVYMLRQMAGSQILADMNITKGAEAAATAKGLMIFGEDVCIDRENYDFIMVQDTHMTETASKADVVFPLMILPEVDGMYVNSERKLSWTEQAVESEIEYRTSEIAQKIAEVFEKSISAPLPCELYPKASLAKPYPETVLCADGFGFDDKKARLRTEADAPIFESAALTSHLVKTLNSKA